MEKVLEIIKDRILLAEKRKGEATTPDMEAFWDGQLRCAQALLNDVARLTKRAADSLKAGEIPATRRVRKSKVIRPAKSG